MSDVFDNPQSPCSVHVNLQYSKNSFVKYEPLVSSQMVTALLTLQVQCCSFHGDCGLKLKPCDPLDSEVMHS